MIPEMALMKAEQWACGTVRRTKGLTSEEVSYMKSHMRSYIGGAWQRVGSSFHGILSSTMRGMDQLSRRGALGILGGAAIAGTTAIVEYGFGSGMADIGCGRAWCCGEFACAVARGDQAKGFSVFLGAGM
jgi:hypothetical protein